MAFKRGKRPKDCKYCGKSPLRWNDGVPGFYLLERDGSKHVCNATGPATIVQEPVQEQEERIEETADPSIYYGSAEVPASEPVHAHRPGSTSGDLSVLASLLRPYFPELETPVTPSDIEPMIEAAIQAYVSTPTRIEVFNGPEATEPVQVIDKAHKQLPKLIKALQTTRHDGTRMPVLLVGPAGSMKTSAAKQAAKVLGLGFYSMGLCDTTQAHDIFGFNDATGQPTITEFRRAFVQPGGLVLFDEIDAGNPNALTSINSPLSNGFGTFPDGRFDAHESFHFVATANTFGRGADRQYVGRNPLDAATLDRFTVIYWEYDEELEKALIPPSCPEWVSCRAWVKHVHKVREAILALNVKHIASSRAVLDGAAYLSAGFDWKEVEEMVLWKGLDKTSREKIEANI